MRLTLVIVVGLAILWAVASSRGTLHDAEGKPRDEIALLSPDETDLHVFRGNGLVHLDFGLSWGLGNRAFTRDEIRSELQKQIRERIAEGEWSAGDLQRIDEVSSPSVNASSSIPESQTARSPDHQ